MCLNHRRSSLFCALENFAMNHLYRCLVHATIHLYLHSMMTMLWQSHRVTLHKRDTKNMYLWIHPFLSIWSMSYRGHRFYLKCANIRLALSVMQTHQCEYKIDMVHYSRSLRVVHLEGNGERKRTVKIYFQCWGDKAVEVVYPLRSAARFDWVRLQKTFQLYSPCNLNSQMLNRIYSCGWGYRNIYRDLCGNI